MYVTNEFSLSQLRAQLRRELIKANADCSFLCENFEVQKTFDCITTLNRNCVFNKSRMNLLINL